MNSIPESYLTCYNYHINQMGLTTPIKIRNRMVRRINFEIQGQQRCALVVDSINPNTSALVFYHGSRGLAWVSLLFKTNFLESFDGTIIFGQAWGDVLYPLIHPTFGGISYGELYFEIRDIIPQFQIDLEYTKYLVNILKSFSTNIYFVGHSNGGVFGLLLALYPGLFTGIISHMGGIGWDPHFYLDFSLLDAFPVSTWPLLFIYTSEYDEHRIPCEQARNIFIGHDFPTVDWHLQSKTGHKYIASEAEPVFLTWFDKISRRQNRS